MKIVDAVWEKRNLGMDAVEFEIDNNDPCDLIRQELINNEKNYNVVKVHSNSFEIYKLLSDLGYAYTENMFHLLHNLRLNCMNPIQKRLSDSITYSPMGDADLNELFLEIGDGMFETDRIALNPYFGTVISNKRYINWIKDELNRHSEMFAMQYKGENIGFFGYKMIEQGIYFPFLAGMYKKYKNSGLGIGIVTKPIEESQRRNAKYNSTYVSSNNLSALSLHLSLGFQIESITSVLCKTKI